MSLCLTEQMLMVLRAGEGSAQERAHLHACPACALRYRELEDDLDVIANALRTSPIPMLVPPAPPARWRPVGAIAATVLLTVAAARLWRGTSPGQTGDVGVSGSEELADTLFATPEAIAMGEEAATDVADDSTGLDDGDDEDDELALLFEGP